MPVGEALEHVLAHPSWWAVAAGGFLARGGLLFFLAPLVALPSPVTVTLVVGIDAISGSGEPSSRLTTAIALLVLAALATAIALVLIAAWADTELFARVAETETDADSASEAESARESRLPGRRAPIGRLLGLGWLQALGLLPGLVAVGLAAPALRDAVVREYLLPSVLEVPFIVRVLDDAQGPLLRAVAVLVLAEAALTIATRAYLAARGSGSTASAYVAAFAWIVRHPIAAIGTWLVGWAVLLGATAVGLLAVALAWARVRTALLHPGLEFYPLSTVIEGIVVPSVLFVVVWLAAIVFGGVASAFRSTLWTISLTARPLEAGGVRWRSDAVA